MSDIIHEYDVPAEAWDVEREGEEEMPVYANADIMYIQDLRTKKSDTKKKRMPQCSGMECLRNRISVAAIVCLGLLCVVLLAAVTALRVQINTESEQFHIKSNSYTEEKLQLQTENTDLLKEKDQLQTQNTDLLKEKDQLQAQNTDLLKEKHQLQAENTDLKEEKKKLEMRDRNLTVEMHELTLKYENVINERNQLNERLGMCEVNIGNRLKRDGWISHQCSFYYISTERKTWNESRRECLERRADLLIINSGEEQNYVRSISGSDRFWIGLSNRTEEGTWKWVDGTTPSPGFWWTSEPSFHSAEICAVSDITVWHNYPCTSSFRWICEISIS